MNIGLVLSSLPGYSETFIRSKIIGLKNEGFNVRVFLSNRATERVEFEYINPYPRSLLLFVAFYPFVVLSLVLFRPVVLIGFIRRERGSGRSYGSILKALYFHAHLLQARKLDWLHFTFATFAIGRENIAASIGAKFAVSLRGFDIGIYPLKHPGCYAALWRSIDKVHTISDDLYALALKDGLPRTVRHQKVRPAIGTRHLQRKQSPGFIHDSCRIVSIGRLEWKKGFEYALRAMHLLKDRGIDFNYTIVGGGSMEEELRFAIYELGLNDHVRLAGKLTHKETLTLLRESDVYVQPSVQEGFCNALLEAQGTGLLCIATTAEGLQENVLHEETGWIVKKRDATGLADAIERVIRMPHDQRVMIVSRAIERVEHEFLLERLVREFDIFYRD